MTISAEEYAFLNNLEKVVASWLVKRGIAFQTQAPMFGGIGELGSATVDFILVERNVAIRTMGRYWHSGLGVNARDLLGREKLAEAGYTIVDVWEDDINHNLDATMELAIAGQEMLK